MENRPVSHWLYIGALVVMWGSAFLLIRIAAPHLNPMFLTGTRLALAACLLVPVALFMGGLPPLRNWGWLAGIALMGNAVPFSLLAWSLKYVDSGFVGICMAVMPLVTIVLAHFFIEGERLTPAKAVGFLVGFLGIVVLIGPSQLMLLGQGDANLVLAQLAALGGAMCFGVQAIIIRRAPQMHPVQMTAGVMIMGGLFVAIPAIMNIPDPATVPTSAWVAVIAIGIVPTALATIVAFRAVQAAGPSFFSQINYLIPLWSVFLGAVLLGEKLPLRAFVALAIILLALAMTQGKIGWLSGRGTKARS